MDYIDSDEFQSNFDFKKIVQNLLNYKKLYITYCLLFLLVAYIYNRITPESYSNHATILISEKENNILGSSGDILQGMSFIPNMNNIDNQIEVLKSFSLVKEAIQKLDFYPTIITYKKSIISDYFLESPFVKKTELYNESPIKILINPTQDQATYVNFNIKFIDEKSFEIEVKGDNIYLYNYIDEEIVDRAPSVYFKNVYNFDDEIKTKYFSFKILKTTQFDQSFTDDNGLYFYLNNINKLTSHHQKCIKAEPVSQLASIIKISCTLNNSHKVSEFINALSSVFLERNLEKKNNAASSTVSFIDAQISDFADSLSYAEANLKEFRSVHKVMDLSFQGQQVFEKLNELETEKSNLHLQKRYYNYLKDYFAKNDDVSDLLAPSSMNVVDPILTKLVSELISLNSERVSLSRNNLNSENILLKDMNIRINNLKKTIRENVDNSLSTIDISMNEIDYRINKLTNQISNMPKTELQLKGIERKFELNSAIYTFLLQKRSEAQIAKASSMPDYEIIEPARFFAYSTVAPRKKLNYLIALFLGFLLPTGYILGIDFFNNTVRDIEEVERLSPRPILGKIFHSYRKNSLIVAQRPTSSVSESFRTVRTNFQFFDEGGRKQVVLLTSSASGDGKTFCSINFATALALNGHRTVLLEFDLRRPKVHQEFGSSNMIGITSYLIEKAVIDDIIVPTEVQNLDLISAGPAAPNPAELIASERTPEFLDKLKEMYDYIIIDSAPVGVVSETFLLMKHSDVNIFVVRLEYTHKEAFKNALKGLKNNKFNEYSLLINDVSIKKESQKYGYDNKYYVENKRGFFSKLFRSKRSE